MRDIVAQGMEMEGLGRGQKFLVASFFAAAMPSVHLNTSIAAFRCRTNDNVKLPSLRHFQDRFQRANTTQRKTKEQQLKEQQLKGEIASALFSHFSHFSQKSHIFRIFPTRLFLELRGFSPNKTTRKKR